jgi:hypothetical protein
MQSSFPPGSLYPFFSVASRRPLPFGKLFCIITPLVVSKCVVGGMEKSLLIGIWLEPKARKPVRMKKNNRMLLALHILPEKFRDQKLFYLPLSKSTHQCCSYLYSNVKRNVNACKFCLYGLFHKPVGG